MLLPEDAMEVKLTVERKGAARIVVNMSITGKGDRGEGGPAAGLDGVAALWVTLPRVQTMAVPAF